MNFSAPGIITTREVIMRGMTQSSTNQSAHISIITGTLIPIPFKVSYNLTHCLTIDQVEMFTADYFLTPLRSNADTLRELFENAYYGLKQLCHDILSYFFGHIAPNCCQFEGKFKGNWFLGLEKKSYW